MTATPLVRNISRFSGENLRRFATRDRAFAANRLPVIRQLFWGSKSQANDEAEASLWQGHELATITRSLRRGAENRHLPPWNCQGMFRLMPPNTKLPALEFRLFRRLSQLKDQAPLQGSRVLVACSGGMDSVALATAMAHVAPRFEMQVVIGSIHHGISTDLATRRARAAAIRGVRELARGLNLEFVSQRAGREHGELASEESLREFRHAALRRLAERTGCRWIALAHHADDLFETRLIRLIRGSSPQGLVSMREVGPGPLLRPFLPETRAEIARYAEKQGLTWLDDPTNQDLKPLRNWLRHKWLQDLDAKRPGACKALARSLESLAEFTTLQAKADQFERASAVVSKRTMSRGDFLRLGTAERRLWLASQMRSFGTRNFTSSHIDEIRKRVETSRRASAFQLLGLIWHINAEQISVSPAADESRDRLVQKTTD